jgi:hypothetical protein
MVDPTPEWRQSHAHAVLRRSSKRLLLFINGEIARCGGGSVSIHNDQLAVVGSFTVVLPGLSELHALGLLDVTRYPKRHVCAISERWRDIRTMRDAKIVSVVARVQRKPPQPSQPGFGQCVT